MRLRKKLLLLAALTALATAVLGGTAQIARGDALHPTCTWSVDKTASLHSNPGVPITTLNLSLDQTITIDYKIVVTRDCEEGFDPVRRRWKRRGCRRKCAGRDVPGPSLPPQHEPARVGNVHLQPRHHGAPAANPFDVINKVDVVDGDPLHPFATDTNTIHVVVHCDGGCTLTQGYWKTHSTYGPASKPDATWNLLPGGAGPNTVFFLSGASWYQVFWTAPAGNAYYNLADQYMAARLNILDGASAPASVSDAITTATGLFGSLHAGADRGALRLECAAEAVRRPGGHPRLLQRGADRSGPLRRVASPVPPRNMSETPGRGGLAVSGTQDSNRPLRTRPEHAREPVRRRSSGTRARTRLAGARARGSRFGPACAPCLDRSSPAPLTERAHVGPAATSTAGRRDRADPRLRSDNDMAPRWRTGTYATGATGSQPGTARGAPAIHLGTCAGCSLVPARPL